jgi:alkylation response protein AidB-like acyl-CoA dehydrogenase
MLVPIEHGGIALSTPAFAAVTEQLARGWMSMAGATGGHSVVCYLIARFGTDEQRAQYLPRLGDGSIRATMALTEPSGGSDLQSMRTTALVAGEELIIKGTKTWISNAAHAGLFALLCKTDPDAEPVHQGMSVVLVEPGTGLHVSNKISEVGLPRR